MNAEACVIGINVGETNTDAVILRGQEVLAISKQLTTADVTTGIVKSLHHVLLSCREKEIRLQQINIGTTHFINAIVKRSADLSKVVVLRLARPPCTEAMPPFYDFPKSLRRLVAGGWHHLNGGYEFDGREISSINEGEIRKAVGESVSEGHTHFVLCGIFSHINHEQECQAKDIILRHFPRVSVTCSHEVSHSSFLERETAAVLNECLRDHAGKVLDQLQESIADLGLACPVYLTQNDGTVCRINRIKEFPILTFGAAAANSMRCAAFLSGFKNAVVADIGEKSITAGVLSDGFPEEAETKINIGGVPMYCRMPVTRNVKLGGESVEGEDHCTMIRKMVETAVDHVKTDKQALPVIVVGSAAFQISIKEPLTGCSKVVTVEHAHIATAVGAALCHVSGSVDIVASEDPTEPGSKQVAVENAKQRAIHAAVLNGAVAESVQISAVHVLQEVSKTATQYKIKAIGDLAVDSSKVFSLDLEKFRMKIPLVEMIWKADPHVLAPGCEDEEEFREEEIREGNTPYDEHGEWILNRYDVECVAIGAAILGCGGGGSPHMGKIRMIHLLETGKRARVVTVDRLLSEIDDPANSFILVAGLIGAPVCGSEKLQTNRTSPLALAAAVDILTNKKAREELPVHSFDGGITYSDNIPVPTSVLEDLMANGPSFKPSLSVMPFEIGGVNTMEPLAVSAAHGIPCVDADGMGRAYPEMQMYTPFIYGAPWSPIIQTSDEDRITISWSANSPKDVENFHRHICVQNGCKANLTYPGIKPTMLNSVCVEGSVSRAWRVGKAVLDARRNKTSPVEAVIEDQGGKLLRNGKIVDIQRQLGGGFQQGEIILQDLQDAQIQFSIVFQNENVIVKQDNTVLAMVPDLICMLEMESGKPVTTEEARYGVRIAVIGLPPSPMLTSDKALPICGPNGFGFDIQYRSIFG